MLIQITRKKQLQCKYCSDIIQKDTESYVDTDNNDSVCLFCGKAINGGCIIGIPILLNHLVLLIKNRAIYSCTYLLRLLNNRYNKYNTNKNNKKKI